MVFGLSGFFKKPKSIFDQVVDALDGSDDEYESEARCEDDVMQEESVSGHMLGLWRDPEFSASRPDKILGGDLDDPNIEWLRPHEISDDPQFYSGGGSQFDVVQGSLGDCWLLAAMATLTLHEDLLQRVAPEQSFDPDNGYNGKFYFNIFQYGQWVKVEVDDRLPTRNGRLIFVQSASNNEFWSALLEKAYAKLVGCYKNMEGGHGSEAMVDLTGGMCEYIEWKKGQCDAKERYSQICDALMDEALITTAIQAQSKADMEARRSDGLVVGHAYSITGAGVYNADGHKYHLLRLRNPWGACEWNGDFGDDSGRWEEDADLRGNDEDGEFWIKCSDWAENFTKIEVCRLDPDDFDTDGIENVWVREHFKGEWNRGDGSAGGCRNYQTFTNNPHRVVELQGGEASDQILISLQQKHRRQQKAKGIPMLAIGFEVFKCENPGAECLADMIDPHSPVYSATFVARRDYTKSIKIDEAGTYVIVPSTFRQGSEGKFYMRIFVEQAKESRDDDEGDDDGWW